MKARLTQYAAPWLLLSMFAAAPADAERSASPLYTMTPAVTQAAAETATASLRLAWDRVGAPMNGLA